MSEEKQPEMIPWEVTLIVERRRNRVRKWKDRVGCVINATCAVAVGCALLVFTGAELPSDIRTPVLLVGGAWVAVIVLAFAVLSLWVRMLTHRLLAIPHRNAVARGAHRPGGDVR